MWYLYIRKIFKGFGVAGKETAALTFTGHPGPHPQVSDAAPKHTREVVQHRIFTLAPSVASRPGVGYLLFLTGPPGIAILFV